MVYYWINIDKFMKSKTGKISLLIKRHWINQCPGEHKSLRWGNKSRDASPKSVPAKLFILECVK